MTAVELCHRLGVKRSRLDAWLRSGLPSSKDARGRLEFDPAATRDWLVSEGILQAEGAPPPPAAAAGVKTLGQIARHFGVSERQVGYWKREGMPAGLDGKGPYDLAAIDVWLATKKGATGSTAQDELMQIRARRERMELAKDEQLLVDKDLPARVFARHITEATQQHAQLVDRLMAAVADLPADRQDRWRQIAEKFSREVRLGLAASLEEWAAELEEEPGGKGRRRS